MLRQHGSVLPLETSVFETQCDVAHFAEVAESQWELFCSRETLTAPQVHNVQQTLTCPMTVLESPVSSLPTKQTALSWDSMGLGFTACSVSLP